MPTLLFLLLSLSLLLPAPRLETDPCPQGTPVATPAAGQTVEDLCPTTPTPAGSTVHHPVASTGNSNLQTGETAGQNSRNSYLIAAGVVTIILGAAGFLVMRRPNKRGNS
jgi:hypothetical protein